MPNKITPEIIEKLLVGLILNLSAVMHFLQL